MQFKTYVISIILLLLYGCSSTQAPSTTNRSVSNIELSHIVINYDAKNWLGNEVEIGGSEKTGAALISPNLFSSVFILDMPEKTPDLDNIEDPIATVAKASLLAKGIYKDYYSFSEGNEIFIIASKKFPGGWGCMQGLVKKSADSIELQATYCATINYNYWVYASLDGPQDTGRSNYNNLRNILLRIEPKK